MSSAKDRTLLQKLSYLIGAILIALLIGGHASRFIHPDVLWFLPFLGMAFPIIALTFFLFLGYWVIKRSKFLVLGIITMLMVWSSLSRTFQINLNNENAASNTLKVMSYNVRLFDFYNWSRVGETRDWIYVFLEAQQPDILCIQEFYHDNTGYFPTLDTLSEVNSIKHMHLENYFNISEERQWGMATLTRYPIVAQGRINFEGTYGNLCIYTDMLIDSDTVRVYNTHLQSVRFDHEDYKLMEDLLEKSELEDVKKSRLLLERMHDAWVKRADQAQLVAKHIANCPYPIILCGDFNDGPVSWAYEKLSAGLTNSFVSTGNGIGNTYVGIFPFLRIDNIFYSNQFKSTEHTVHAPNLSDHFAISAQLQLKEH